MDFWKEFEKVQQEEGAGDASSGGIVCQARVELGYKAYVSDASQDESFFGSTLNKANRNLAKMNAQAYANQHGANDPRWTIRIVAIKDTALRIQEGKWQPVTWQGDRYFDENTWTRAAKEVIIPSVQNNGITDIPATIWCRLGFKADPYKVDLGEAGRTEQDQKGNLRFPTVAYIVETFPNEAAARAAISSDTTATTTTTSPAPEGWSQDDWDEALPSIREEIASGESKFAVAKKYGYPINTLVEA